MPSKLSKKNIRLKCELSTIKSANSKERRPRKKNLLPSKLRCKKLELKLLKLILTNRRKRELKLSRQRNLMKTASLNSNRQLQRIFKKRKRRSTKKKKR